MPRYSSIFIIYNPRSTGSSKRLARKLQRDIKRRLPQQSVSTISTERSKHAEELAYKHAVAEKHALVISSSGDGGYHEVVNGLMRAQREGKVVTAGLLPGGNANDHFKHMHTPNVIAAIADGHEQTIDLLRFQYLEDGELVERYAHSYIGIGLTPQAGQELNRHDLNRLNQIWIVARVLLVSLTPVRLLIDGKVQAYDNLIFSNIRKMSKLLSLSPFARVDDGKFEVTTFPHRNKLRLLLNLLTASTRGLSGESQATVFRFTTIEPTSVQLDGEIITLPADCQVTVTIVPAALQCII